MRAVLAAWQAGNGAHLAKAYLERSKQYVAWVDKSGPRPASMSSGPSATRPSGCDTPLLNNTIHQHLNMLRNPVAHARLPTKHIKHGFAHEAKKCYPTWEELQQLPAWQPPASQPSLQRQQDVFVARCLCGLRYSDTMALLRPHIQAGSRANHLMLDQQKTRARVQTSPRRHAARDSRQIP